MMRNAIITAAMAATLVLFGGRGSAWAANPPAFTSSGGSAQGSPAPRGHAPARAPAASDSEGYAAREANAKELQDFRGGDVVIVGSTGVIIVLLVLVLLLVA